MPDAAVSTAASPAPAAVVEFDDDLDQGPSGEGEHCEASRWAVFAECPHCAGEMAPEHAHYRCAACGWRDSCCD